MKKCFGFLLLTAILTAVPASAQLGVIQIGPRVGYDLDWEALSLGVDARAEMPSLPVMLNVAADYYLLEDFEGFGTSASQSLINISANALYIFGIDNAAFTPYAGAGLAIMRYSVDVESGFGGSVDLSSTDLGVNLLGGALFGSGSLRPFVQAQLTFGGGETIGLMGGVLFTI